MNPAAPRFCVTAHRGNSSEFVENTLAAVDSAVRLGADWVEVDVRRAACGTLVIHHDPTTVRTSRKSVRIADTPFSVLRAIELDKIEPSHATSESLRAHRKIPDLMSMIELIMSSTTTRLSLQIKTADLQATVDLVHKMRAEAWVGYNDVFLKKLLKVRSLAPHAPIFWDRPPWSGAQLDLRFAKKLKPISFVLHKCGLNVRRVERYGSAYELGAWVVNSRQLAVRLASYGIRRVYTDRPRLLCELPNESSVSS